MGFYNFASDPATGSDALYIDGEISSEESWWGDTVVAREFRRALSRTRDVTVYINSPGGDVFAGAEIYNALREHKGKVTVKVTGLAASAASLIAMAGDEVLMSPVSYMMIHDPWGIAQGNARDMDHMADVLRTIGEGLIAAYTAKTGKGRDEIAGLLAAETYMSAQTAVDEGFADGILYDTAPAPAEGGKATAKLTTAKMLANRYGIAAAMALVKPAGDPPAPDPAAALRAEIAARAEVIHQIYQGTIQ